MSSYLQLNIYWAYNVYVIKVKDLSSDPNLIFTDLQTLLYTFKNNKENKIYRNYTVKVKLLSVELQCIFVTPLFKNPCYTTTVTLSFTSFIWTVKRPKNLLFKPSSL